MQVVIKITVLLIRIKQCYTRFYIDSFCKIETPKETCRKMTNQLKPSWLNSESCPSSLNT